MRRFAWFVAALGANVGISQEALALPSRAVQDESPERCVDQELASPAPLLQLGPKDEVLRFELFVDPQDSHAFATVRRALLFWVQVRDPSSFAIYSLPGAAEDSELRTALREAPQRDRELRSRLQPASDKLAQSTCPPHDRRRVTQAWLRKWQREGFESIDLPLIVIEESDHPSLMMPADEIEPLLRQMDRRSMVSAASDRGVEGFGTPSTSESREAWRRTRLEFGARKAMNVLLLPWRQLDDPQARAWFAEALEVQRMGHDAVRILIFAGGSDPSLVPEVDGALLELRARPTKGQIDALLNGPLPRPREINRETTTSAARPLVPLLNATPFRPEDRPFERTLRASLSGASMLQQ